MSCVVVYRLLVAASPIYVPGGLRRSKWNYIRELSREQVGIKRRAVV
jgi:hypothetical protein